jgi:preprotein translocase SecE subunit
MGDWIQKLQDGVRHGTDFIQEAWQELKKVYWPSRKETYAATLVVIVVVLLISGYLDESHPGYYRVILRVLRHGETVVHRSHLFGL